VEHTGGARKGLLEGCWRAVRRTSGA
jgi:hypothetical protein